MKQIPFEIHFKNNVNEYEAQSPFTNTGTHLDTASPNYLQPREPRFCRDTRLTSFSNIDVILYSVNNNSPAGSHEFPMKRLCCDNGARSV